MSRKFLCIILFQSSILAFKLRRIFNRTWQKNLPLDSAPKPICGILCQLHIVKPNTWNKSLSCHMERLWLWCSAKLKLRHQIATQVVLNLGFKKIHLYRFSNYWENRAKCNFWENVLKNLGTQCRRKPSLVYHRDGPLITGIPSKESPTDIKNCGL